MLLEARQAMGASRLVALLWRKASFLPQLTWFSQTKREQIDRSGYTALSVGCVRHDTTLRISTERKGWRWISLASPEHCVVPAIHAASERCACQQHRLPNKLINFRKKAAANGFHTCKGNQVWTDWCAGNALHWGTLMEAAPSQLHLSERSHLQKEGLPEFLRSFQHLRTRSNLCVPYCF